MFARRRHIGVNRRLDTAIQEWLTAESPGQAIGECLLEVIKGRPDIGESSEDIAATIEAGEIRDSGQGEIDF